MIKFNGEWNQLSLTPCPWRQCHLTPPSISRDHIYFSAASAASTLERLSCSSTSSQTRRLVTVCTRGAHPSLVHRYLYLAHSRWDLQTTWTATSGVECCKTATRAAAMSQLAKQSRRPRSNMNFTSFVLLHFPVKTDADEARRENRQIRSCAKSKQLHDQYTATFAGSVTDNTLRPPFTNRRNDGSPIDQKAPRKTSGDKNDRGFQ